jgi:hypothetical protein
MAITENVNPVEYTKSMVYSYFVFYHDDLYYDCLPYEHLNSDNDDYY